MVIRKNIKFVHKTQIMDEKKICCESLNIFLDEINESTTKTFIFV